MKLRKIHNLHFYTDQRSFYDYYPATGHKEDNVIFRIINENKRYLIFDVYDLDATGQYVGQDVQVSSKILEKIFNLIENWDNFNETP